VDPPTLQQHCRLAPNTATQSLPTLPHGRQAALPPPRHGEMPCLAARQPCTLPRPAGFHMPSRARRRGAACACPGRRVNARARGKAAGLFMTAIASDASPRARCFFAICQKCRHARLHPLITKRLHRSSQASPRRVQRSARGIGVLRPLPATHPHARQNIDPASPQPLVSVSPDKATNQHCQIPLTPPGAALPALPITAIGRTATAGDSTADGPIRWPETTSRIGPPRQCRLAVFWQ